jgi:3-hydroxy-5-methyl-1-naphthoate 3-O-methyltransferase
MSHELTHAPATDPTQVYRYRDGLYAQDMLITGLVWLDLFTWLARHPSDAAAIMQQFDTTERPTDVMLTLFVAMELIERRDGVYHVTATAREHLCAGSPWFLGPYYASLKERPVCQDLLKVLRTDKPANWGSEKGKEDWHKSMETEEFARQFTAAMDCRGVYLAQAVAKKIDLSARRQLLDIAGGSGIYACSFCAHFPNLRATVLEKSPVDKITSGAVQKRGFSRATVLEKSPVDRITSGAVQKRGVSDRVSVIASDMLGAPLPGGFDAHLFSNVLHDWDVPVVQQLVRKSFDALAPGGTLIIHDAFLNEDKTGPLHVAEYSVLLMHSTEGRCYSVAEMKNYLTEAGFGTVTFTTTAAARGVMTALKS